MIRALRTWLLQRRLNRSQRRQITREIFSRVVAMRKPKMTELPLKTRLLAAHINASHWIH